LIDVAYARCLNLPKIATEVTNDIGTLKIGR
jgi:hypothetical protein